MASDSSTYGGRRPLIDLTKLIVVSAILVLAIGAFNYAVDPLQIFHRSWFFKARYASDARIANVGLIESQPFDTVFMGTSYSHFIRQREIDDALGGKSLKLVVSGGTSREQNVILSAVLRKKPRRIVWQMDDFMFRDSGDPSAYLRTDLYERNLRGLLGYLFSLDTGRESLWAALGQWKPTRRLGYRLNEIGYLKLDRDDPAELNSFPPDGDPDRAFNEANARAAFAAHIANPTLALAGLSHGMKDNFERDAIGLIEANSDVSFIIYFPPSSILSPLALRIASPAIYESMLHFNEYQLQRLSRLPNVAAFDFRATEEITHDLKLYRDTIHYRPEINRKLLGFLARGLYEVDKENPAAALQLLKAQVERYTTGTDRRME